VIRVVRLNFLLQITLLISHITRLSCEKLGVFGLDLVETLNEADCKAEVRNWNKEPSENLSEHSHHASNSTKNVQDLEYIPGRPNRFRVQKHFRHEESVGSL
jgi:hypothetical protein